VQILGIDIGGTGIKGAPVNIATGTLVEERFRVETPNPATPAQIAEAVRQIVQHFHWTGKIGCGFPAIMRRGVALSAANIDASWIGLDAQSLFKEATGCSTALLNDADAAGIAEMAFGAAKGRSGVVLVLTVGTGIGSALFVDGKLVPNTELGHLQFNGTIAEKYCSNATRKRDDLSWREWGTRFDDYLSHLKRLFYPEVIIVGGGQSRKFEKFAEYIKTDIEVIPAHFLNEAGIIGAAIAAREGLV
jgi:polyphosphate glucokinase